MSVSQTPRQADLVFEGGGVKGIGLAGAFRELSDQGYQPGCVAGTSAGAITAALVAAGYSGAELQELVLDDMSFKAFADRELLERLGPAGDIGEFMRHGGLHSGDYFLNWMRERLAAKGVRQFGDLPCPDPSDPIRKYRLQVIASDLSARSMLVLPRDADQLGLDPDGLEIAQAVRMSMSIPVFFAPVQVTDPRGVVHKIVDGGLLSNFPVWLFDCAGTPNFPTFGLLLVAPSQKAPLVPDGRSDHDVAVPVGSELDFVKAMAETMMEAHDRLYVEQANYARTIAIPTLGVRTTEFDIPATQAQALFDSGREAARTFLNSWDFDTYIARYRSAGASATRRSTV